MVESTFKHDSKRHPRQLSAVGRRSSFVLEDNRVLQRNNTGLPDNLKAGMENLTGANLDHVRVHYNSPKPTTVQAHAYAQGNEIHLASQQEKQRTGSIAGSQGVVQRMMGLRSRGPVGGTGKKGGGGDDDEDPFKWSKDGPKGHYSEKGYYTDYIKNALGGGSKNLKNLPEDVRFLMKKMADNALKGNGVAKIQISIGGVKLLIAAGVLMNPTRGQKRQRGVTGLPRGTSNRRMVVLLRVPAGQSVNIIRDEYGSVGYTNVDSSNYDLWGETQHSHLIGDSMMSGSQKDAGLPTVKASAFRNQVLDKAAENKAMEVYRQQDANFKIIYLVIEWLEK